MPHLEFKGKYSVYSHHLTVPHHPLVPDPARSVGPMPADDNLVVHGDNLLALKALLPRYAERVKCVYIDPPYNTGNEKWAYNDNVNSPQIRTWLNAVVDREDLERHDKWLCMMWPRLHLIRGLLADDGVIFVSIDDNEAAHLRSWTRSSARKTSWPTSFGITGSPARTTLTSRSRITTSFAMRACGRRSRSTR